jgi:hypothetical protein
VNGQLSNVIYFYKGLTMRIRTTTSLFFLIPLFYTTATVAQSGTEVQAKVDSIKSLLTNLLFPICKKVWLFSGKMWNGRNPSIINMARRWPEINWRWQPR